MKILSFSLCFYPTGAFSPYQEADVCVGAVDEGDCPHVTPRPVDSHGPLRDEDGNGEQKSHDTSDDVRPLREYINYINVRAFIKLKWVPQFHRLGTISQSVEIPNKSRRLS
ncbi:hypothetical protein QJS10_CPA09g01112 [Acorus calamus]|uniref:Uncharacterized protein n=1 Tax=Acorus calamus TaxID=4465 RepID=A0AAV9E9Z0_ACOCL|nr:hypothetical protein QJS10_CPA09g01112 [Acorus calamus]